MAQTDPAKKKVNHRDGEGKVITQNPNMLISPQSKINYDRNK